MRNFVYWIAPFYTACIVYLSLDDNGMPAIDVENIDKLYHSAAYFVMTVLWYFFFMVWAFRKHLYQPALELTRYVVWENALAWRTAIVSLLIGALLEVGQGYLSANRSMDFYDMLANSSGIILALLTLWLLSRKNKIR